MKQHFVALDRDGTIIVEKNYLSNPDEVELLPGAVPGLQKLIKAGWKLIIVSNQSGIGRGYFSPEDYQKVTTRLSEMLQREDIELSGIYHCPHTPEDNCACRKPKTGMLLKAAQEHNFRPADCVVIGDKPADVELGRNAQAALSLIVRTGYGEKSANVCKADGVFANLEQAADFIIHKIPLV